MKIVRVQLQNEVTYAVLKEDKVFPIKGLPYEKIETDGREFAAAEAKLAAEVMALQAVDPTIGYESSNHYFFTRSTLLEKLINCDDILNRA